MCQEHKPYPLEILPRPHYVKELKINKLLGKYKGLMVVRLVSGTPDSHKRQGTSGEMKLSDTVFENSMPNWSLNFSGGLFDTSHQVHLPFLPISEYGSAHWDGKKVNKNHFRTDNNFSITEPCFGLCFRVKDIHERTFPFHKGFKSQQEWDEYVQKVQDKRLVDAFVSKTTPVDMKARLKLHHAPTNGNYWHVTLDTYRPTDHAPVGPDEHLNNTDRNMFKALKHDLLQCCDIDLVPDYKFKKCDYLRWYACLIPGLAG